MGGERTALILGAAGQMGRALVDTTPAGVQVLERDRSGLDITDHAAVSAELKVLRPDLVINAAAYTDVDAAEDDPERAFAVNGAAVAGIARACAATGARSW